jgi:O-antigen/teichoic acid export membrane protein
MSASAARHFAYSIGQGDTEVVNQWFNSAFSIHLIMPIALILTGWPIGEYCISNVLTIPSDRIVSCLWVFRISLVSAFFSMITIPFSAMFTAKQHITELAVWGILQSIMTFVFAFLLTHLSGDRLIFYAMGMVAISVCFQTSQSLRALFIFSECRLRYSQWFNAERFKKIISFALWSLFGNSAGLLRNQGVIILLNLYFGPKVNSAYGISSVVSAQTGMLSNSMLGSFSPEIVASEGKGDRTRMIDLSIGACKLGTLLVMFFAIPLMVEMDYVLKLWLQDPPPYTATFCQLMLIMFMIDQLTVGYMVAVSAHGRIAAYQATLGTLAYMNLPLAWLFLKFGYTPTSVVVAFIITSVILSLGRVFWGRRLLGMSVNRWLTDVVLPCTVVATISTFAALASVWWLQPSFSRLVLEVVVSVTVTALASWFFALDYRERTFILQNIRR